MKWKQTGALFWVGQCVPNWYSKKAVFELLLKFMKAPDGIIALKDVQNVLLCVFKDFLELLLFWDILQSTSWNFFDFYIWKFYNKIQKQSKTEILVFSQKMVKTAGCIWFE